MHLYKLGDQVIVSKRILTAVNNVNHTMQSMVGRSATISYVDSSPSNKYPYRLKFEGLTDSFVWCDDWLEFNGDNNKKFSEFFGKVMLSFPDSLGYKLIYAKNDEVNIESYDWLDFEKENVTFLPLNRFVEGEDPYKSNKRQAMRLGRFIKKYFKEPILDSVIEKTVNQIKSLLTPKSISIVEGEDIRKWYLYSTYDTTSGGTLNSSCMREKECSKYLDIYVNNPEVVKMAIATNEDGKLIARALLWYADDKVFMDRVYFSHDKHSLAFFIWAKNNDFVYRFEQNYEHPFRTVFNDGANHEWKASVKIKTTEDALYPFMDSFRYLRNNVLYNYTLPYEHLELSCTNGTTKERNIGVEPILEPEPLVEQLSPVEPERTVIDFRVTSEFISNF
jgi:hypothetical protein